jgi:3-hydroxybutyryl-CoA dehydrogenase
VPEALESGMEKIAAGLAKLVEKGKIDEAEAAAIRGRVEPCAEIAGLADSELVVEAAPEQLDLKLEIFNALAEACGPGAVLATNTSSLSVTEIAAGVPGPERVVGLHFFNPAPVMKLAEVVAGARSSEAALALARATGEAMGKQVVRAADVPGFLVNRCNRPFSLESLKLLEEGSSTPAQVDRVLRMGGGFRMGPFELMDLIGIDTNHAVAESFQRQSFGEPRYRPSPLAARKVAAGTLGRKTGEGWYSYGDGRPADPDPPPAGGGDGRPLLVVGELPVAEELIAAAREAGWEPRRPAEAPADPWLTLDFTGQPADPDRAPAHIAKFLHAGSLHRLDPQAAGFHVVPPLAGAKLIEVTQTPRTHLQALSRLNELVRSLGRHAEPVADAPGLISGRVLAQLVNEAAFLVGERNGSAADVDTGMELGLSHPLGSVKRSEAMGLDHVLAVLDALRSELGEERYRAAPLIRRRAALGGGLRD